MESLQCLVRSGRNVFNNIQKFTSSTFTPAVTVMCIDDIVRPSFNMLCKQLKDHLTVLELANFWLLADKMTVIW